MRQTINGAEFRRLLISAAASIEINKQTLNELNVFPVPDGDTGTNMSMTISAAKRELECLSDDATVAEVSQTAASALLRGARGNSGVILSLLFRGFSKGLSGKKTAEPADLANALSLGVEAAYKAVMKPTEGTILTVSRLAAEAAKDLAVEAGENLCGFWDNVCSAASAALDKTPELLPVLKKAGVVDAGGKGFLVVLEGMASVIRDGVVIPLDGASSDGSAPPAQVGSFFKDEHGFEGEITFTYCTEFIVLRNEQSEQSPLTLRAYLETIGDCVVVVDDEEIIKVHVHTDNPGKALQKGLEYGMLTKMKIENMREQFQAGVAAAEQQAKAGQSANGFAYAPVDPSREYGFVAVSAGEGIGNLFCELGVDHVVSGGQTMNPSTDDILAAVQATPAKTVYVLPNNKNIIMAAEQAVKLADRKVLVLPTTAIPQGLSAMLAFDPSADCDANYIEMQRAAGQVATGQVTFAARDSDFENRKIQEGDILGLENGKLTIVEKDVIKAAVRLGRSLIKRQNDCSFVTILYGEGATEAQAREIKSALSAKHPDLEFSVVNGGQPVYYFIISAE